MKKGFNIFSLVLLIVVPAVGTAAASVGQTISGKPALIPYN